MIQKVEMYQAVCDGCGKPCVDSRRGFKEWANRESAMLNALISGWHKIDGKLYCPDCVEWDKETKSYKPKKKEQ